MFSHFPDPSLIEETSYPGSLSKVLRFGAFSSAFFNLFFAFFYGLNGYPGFMVWVCAGGFLIALSCLLLQKLPRRHWLAAQVVTFSIYFTMFPIVLITGGINSSSILWMVFIPIAATVMSGTGGGLLWSAFICWVSSLAWTTPWFYPPAPTAW